MDPKSPSEYFATYPVNLSKDQMMIMMREIINLSIDFSYTGDQKTFEGNDEGQYDQELESFKDAKKSYIDKLMLQHFSIDIKKTKKKSRLESKKLLTLLTNFLKLLYTFHIEQ